MRSRMLRRVLVPFLLFWLIGSASAFAVAHFFTLEAFDRALLDEARVIAAYVVERDGQLILDLSARELAAVVLGKTEKAYFSVVQADGAVVASNAELRPALHRPGKSWVFDDISYRDAELRMVTLWLQDKDSFAVVVAQTTLGRQELLQRLGLYSRLPQLALLLCLGWWLYRAIGRELAEFETLQKGLERRDSSDLSPLDTDASSREVERVARAVNELMLRVDRGVQAQREFAGNVAHELRTPLAGIRALAEYGLAQSDPQVWRTQLANIAASQVRASRLIDQLLALALADEARESVTLAPVAVNNIARNVLLSYLQRADAQGVDLGAIGLDQAVVALGDAALLEGALNNLIDNALRYGKPGDASRQSITVKVAQQGDVVLISVTDNGPGIDDALRERLLSRWARGQAGAQYKSGAGLGLAIVARYAVLLGGTLILDTTTGGAGLSATLSLQAAHPPLA